MHYLNVSCVLDSACQGTEIASIRSCDQALKAQIDKALQDLIKTIHESWIHGAIPGFKIEPVVSLKSSLLMLPLLADENAMLAPMPNRHSAQWLTVTEPRPATSNSSV